MEEPRKTDDETILVAQRKLLELRRQRGIPIDHATLERTRQLEKRVLRSRRKAA